MEIKQLIVDPNEKEVEVTIKIEGEELKFFVELGLETAFNKLHMLPINIAEQIEQQLGRSIKLESN